MPISETKKAAKAHLRRETTTIRLSPAERERYEALGGVKWLRAAIKRARLPAYTYNRGFAARTEAGEIVTIPDQVASSQREYDGMTFPVRRDDGSTAPAVLCGDAYGLHTGGTGDPVVSLEAAQ